MGVLLKALKPITGSGIFWPQDYPALDGGIGRSLTGVNVTAETAFGLPAFFAAVRVLSEDIAKLPFIVYESLEPRGKRRAPEHPLYRVLHDQANPEMTAFVWREVSMGHLLTWGNCYSEIQRNGLGEIVALWPLPPDRVTPKRDPETKERFYRIRLTRPNDQGQLEQDVFAVNPRTNLPQIFHVPGLGFDGLVGYNPIDMMAKAIGVGLAAQEYAERFWANDARPGGALNVPPDIGLNDQGKRNLRREFERRHGGLSNAQRLAILEDGITFQDIGIPPETAQFLETRKFQATEMARGMRVPPHKIMDLERATFTNIEHQALEYVQDALGGWAGRIEAQARKDLMERPFFAELLFDALLRGDSLSRAQVYSIYRNIGVLTPNYIAERENFPLRDDPGGDEYLLPLNVTTEGGGTDDNGNPQPLKMTYQVVPDTRSGNGHVPAEVTA